MNKVKERAAAKRPTSIDRDQAFRLLRTMILIRRFEARCAELYSAMKIRGFLHLYDGEEAVAAGVMETLGKDDGVVGTYREHGHALARGIPAEQIMAEMFGKAEGCCRGRGGSMHIFDADTRFYGGNAIVGAGLPVAAGLALADRLAGRSRITCCFFGDGAVAEGEFHETMNLAVLWNLPLLFVCENNLYAMGTALKLTESETDLTRKAVSYRMPAAAVDGMDVWAVERASREAVRMVRNGNGPYFLECRTYRFRAHSMFDAELYRSREEVAEWKERDPITTFTRSLAEAGLLGQAELEAMEASVEAEIEAAVAFAEAGTWEPVEELSRFVYSDPRNGD